MKIQIATCVVEADYLIDMALMKGHVSQGVTLCAKNFFGCTSIEYDWRKNAHSTGFNLNAPDMKYSDYYLTESARAGNPPSGTADSLFF